MDFTQQFYRRTAAFFCIMMLSMLVCILSVFTVANGTELAQTAAQQSSYKLTVTKTRGTIYDASLHPLTGRGEGWVAAVAPTVEAAAALTRIFPPEKMQQIYPSLTAGKPFTLRLPQKAEAQGLSLFMLPQRFQQNQLAAHTLGYLDGSGHGVSGMEKLFDEELSANQGSVEVVYQVDALNRSLAGEEPEISDSSALGKSGVVLTLDETIQQAAEEAARNHLVKGAVVVAEVPSCQIRALVSLPSFDPNNVAEVLEAESAPLLNRAFSAYSVGSVFKLVSASAALQYGISADAEFECTGVIEVDGQEVHCIDGKAHGKLKMDDALAKSCNCYFISLMQQVPQAQFLLMARSMGFGEANEPAPGYFTSSGVLPGLKTLRIPRALANFSFGQGELTATPLQITAMVNAIACGGYYASPSLYKGTVDADLQYTARAEAGESVRVISEDTAAKLRSFMARTVESGNAKRCMPARGGAGVKTSTAQTGRIVDGVEEVESWVAGYFPKDNPKYVITVLGEGGSGGGATCGPVFQEIADALADRVD